MTEPTSPASNQLPIDHQQREQARDPRGSYIVQAPAGSGKTELLTQRYLGLLALVDHPEEIAAITFTRKAAGEMRARILDALSRALEPEPQEAHKRTTWQLACAVIERDRAQNWQLANNPNRLRIQTFDSLSSELTRQMPVMTEIGAPLNILEQAGALHSEAARQTLAMLDDPQVGPHIGRVLRHLDNQLGQVEELIAAMLARRDQWVEHIPKGQQIDQLEAALEQTIEQQLASVAAAIPTDILSQQMQLASYAADHLPDGSDSPIALWAEHKGLPGTDWASLPLWQGLMAVTLKKDNNLRKSFTKREGFPAPGEKGIDAEEKARRTEAKSQAAEMVAQLASQPEVVAALARVSGLPVKGYSQAQAELLESLMVCLFNAAGHLKLVFAETGSIDFMELSQRALKALGDEDAPTDLALALDYRLKHLLVDEFQDTSSTQHHLLRLLTAGWQADDGRTLLLVGDPMQSIYRFREAEVGLYLQAFQGHLGSLSLTPLTLQMNFRSTAGIIDWVNQTFADIFPGEANPTLGAVPYAPSAASKQADPNQAVTVHPRLLRDDLTEAEEVAEVITQTLQTHPDDDIAILVRSRGHLVAIAHALKQRAIPFVAVKTEPLAERVVVQDLRTLTRALLHPADRLAWLSLLRAPCLGLDLVDLLTLAENSEQNLLARLHQPALLQQLSADGQQRITRLLSVLGKEVPRRGRQPLRTWVESIWLALGGLAVAGESAHDDAQAFFALLEQIEEPGKPLDLVELDEQLKQLFAAPDPQAGEQIKMMTMHSAKGLEFDTVILPGLGKKSRNDDKELLYWAETPNAEGTTELLMAPVKASEHSGEEDQIVSFIRDLNKQKDRFEIVRLLYVAATRARRRLHLFGHAQVAQKNTIKPVANSLLQTLWPILESEFIDLPLPEDQPETPLALKATEQRLSSSWSLQLPDAPSAPDSPSDEDPSKSIDYAWAGDTARHVGTLVHRYLERIATQGLRHWPLEKLASLEGPLSAGLAHLGVASDELEVAVAKCLRALRNTLEDETGRWILQDHNEHACELPLTVQDEQAGHYVIDRTFIDEHGTRWIIDYKTGDHQDPDTADFLDAEQARYRDQLENYARIMRLLEERPIKLALYFPLLKDWRVWE